MVAGQSFTYSLWVICRGHTLAIEQESHTVDVFSLAIAESVHELAKLCGTLDLEEHLVVVVRDLNVEVLARRCVLGLLRDVVWR